MGEDNRELNLKFIEILIEVHALRLMVNEALSIVLSISDDPANAVVAARRHVNEAIETAVTKSTAAAKDPEFREWFARKVQNSVNAQLDEVERRVSQLERGRATH